VKRGIMLCAACAAVVALAAAVGAAEKVDFKKIDTNGDNAVIAAEFDAYVVAYPELGLTRAVFDEWDVNKDGTVTHLEFEAWKPVEKGAMPAGGEKAEKK
jgi:hypothetical protein